MAGLWWETTSLQEPCSNSWHSDPSRLLGEGCGSQGQQCHKMPQSPPTCHCSQRRSISEATLDRPPQGGFVPSAWCLGRKEACDFCSRFCAPDKETGWFLVPASQPCQPLCCPEPVFPSEHHQVISPITHPALKDAQHPGSLPAHCLLPKSSTPLLVGQARYCWPCQPPNLPNTGLS